MDCCYATSYNYDIKITSACDITVYSCYKEFSRQRGRVVGSVVEWLKHRTDDQHGLGSKPTYAILLCPWERHFTALSPAWWS